MTIERTEILTSGPAEGLAGLLGVDLPDLSGAGLPALWHWAYLLDRPRQADLGADGHPVRGVVPVPTGPGLRRMWASGRVRMIGALVVERPATRRSWVGRTEDKVGRSGPMTFVTVRHEVVQNGHVVVEEDQNIVYRHPPETSAPSLESAQSAYADVPPEVGEWAIEPSPTLLARFSALTYNGHRIHYDREFTRDVEGYPGLLVHGPLQAIAMAEAARRLLGGAVAPVDFDYRLVAPLFDHQGMVVGAEWEGMTIRTSVRDRAGRATAEGRLVRL